VSERIRNSENNQEQYVDPAEVERINKEAEKKLEIEAARAEKENQFSIDAIHERIERATSKTPEQPSFETKAADTPIGIGKELRTNSRNQTLRRVQKQLPASERTFSRVIHQPAVETLSDVVGGSLARPSGLLFAGLCSIISSLIILYICRHYGYEYNFLIGLVFMAGGFVLGLLLEAVYKIFKRN
jgi:hypothetical protein